MEEENGVRTCKNRWHSHTKGEERRVRCQHGQTECMSRNTSGEEESMKKKEKKNKNSSISQN